MQGQPRKHGETFILNRQTQKQDPANSLHAACCSLPPCLSHLPALALPGLIATAPSLQGKARGGIP